MFYFKFTDWNGDEMYGEISADKEQISIDKLKDIIGAVTLEEVTKEEYYAQDEEVSDA